MAMPYGYVLYKGSLTYRFCPRETSYVRLEVGGGGGGGRFAAVTFLCKTSWKNSIVFSKAFKISESCLQNIIKKTT
jgi:hypothetical protein